MFFVISIQFHIENEIAGAPDPAPEAVPKPAVNHGALIRDAAQRILQLCQKGEWSALDQAFKSLEKANANAGDEAVPTPLLGVSDAVRKNSLSQGSPTTNQSW